MTVSALALVLFAATPLSGDVPRAEGPGLPVAASGVSFEEPQPITWRIDDAPTSPMASFAVSALTSGTGLLVLSLAGFSLPEEGIPGSTASFGARVGTGLFLLSIGPSMGDLANGDPLRFLIGAGGRSALALVGYGLVLGISSRDVGVAALSALGLIGTTLVWMGWGAADLVLSWFAPQRWVIRQNEATASRFSRQPVPEVRGVPDGRIHVL